MLSCLQAPIEHMCCCHTWGLQARPDSHWSMHLTKKLWDLYDYQEYFLSFHHMGVVLCKRSTDIAFCALINLNLESKRDIFDS